MNNTTAGERNTPRQAHIAIQQRIIHTTAKARLCNFAALTLSVLTLLVSTAQAAPNLPPAGLVMHLEATAGVQATGQTVSHWWDQSGYGQDLHASGTPRLIDHGLNGNPVIEFGAAADSLQQPRASSLPTHGNNRTLIVLSAPTNTGANFGYGNDICGGSFALQHDRDGYSALSSGCANSPMHATGQVAQGQWRLHTLVVESGTIYQLRDGKLVDGRASRIDTRPGPFRIDAPDLQGVGGTRSNPGGKLQIAAVLAYNWALGQQELDAVHSYLGRKWFNRASQFSPAPNLQTLTLPKPRLALSKTTNPDKSLLLRWRASFADECSADNGWTSSNATSGSQIISNPQSGAAYGLNCWHSRASATQQFGVNTRPLRITWQQPAGKQRTVKGYRLLLGTRSRDYKEIIPVPFSSNSYTLELVPGTYFLAMSTMGLGGVESDLSGELTFTVD